MDYWVSKGEKDVHFGWTPPPPVHFRPFLATPLPPLAADVLSGWPLSYLKIVSPLKCGGVALLYFNTLSLTLSIFSLTLSILGPALSKLPPPLCLLMVYEYHLTL